MILAITGSLLSLFLNGMTQLGLLIFGCYLGGFFISKSKKTQADLLLFLGLGTIGIGLWQLGGCIDFITLLATETNFPLYLDTSNPLSPFFWYFTTLFEFIFGIVFLFYVAITLVVPKKKYYFFALFLIIIVVISYFYIFEFGTNIEPSNPDEIANSSAISGAPIFYLMIGDVLLFLGFNVIGLLLRSFKSKGIIRKKLIELSIANLLFLIFYVSYVNGKDSNIKLLMRIGVIGSIVIMYFALREAPEKPEKKRQKNRVKVQDGLFRLIERPDEITEEEVSISKEKKICLVCKGKVKRFSFICAKCDAFYCENCAKAIISMENACWACNKQLDKTKPYKPFKKQKIIEVNLTKTEPKIEK